MQEHASFGGSLFDRLTLRHRVSGPSGTRTVYGRFQDFDGRSPSLRSIGALPWIAWTFLRFQLRLLSRRPVPYLAFDAITLLKRVVKPDHRVLEVGGGNSTLWFLSRGARVMTVEHDGGWARAITEEAMRRFPAVRLDVEVKGGADAIGFISGLPDASFDLILIDCLSSVTSRVEAVRAARSKVVPGGWLVLDNSDFPHNKPAVDLMNDRPSRRFTSYAPMGMAVSQTMIWRL